MSPSSRVEPVRGGPDISAHHLLHRSAGRRLGAAALVLALAAAVLAAVPAGAAEGEPYRVRPGETLSDISLRLGVSIRALAAANGLEDPDVVVAGSRLHVPNDRGGNGGTGGGVAGSPARTHRVQPGEHLSGIALRYGVSVPALAAANDLDDADLVVAGSTLTIPAAGTGPATGGGGGGGQLPRRLAQSPTRLALMPRFDQWAAHYGVPADLLKAMTWLESGWQNGVVSSTGAVGIGQLMPDTIAFMQVLIGQKLDPASPDDNIRMSARYLDWLLDRYGSASSALAAYYQGPGSLARRGLYPETARYVADVLSLRGRF